MSNKTEPSNGLVVALSYIGNGLKPIGTILHGYTGPFGAGIRPCDAQGNLLNEDDSAALDVPAEAILRYHARHQGGGNYAVVDGATGERASDLYRKKDGDAEAKANAEASRLNAGGAPVPPEQEADDQSPPPGSGLPDA